MKTFFRPEILNRLDDTVVFRPLSKDDAHGASNGRFGTQDFNFS